MDEFGSHAELARSFSDDGDEDVLFSRVTGQLGTTEHAAQLLFREVSRASLQANDFSHWPAMSSPGCGHYVRGSCLLLLHCYWLTPQINWLKDLRKVVE